RVVALLEELTGIPYPYEKLDVVVPPRYWGTMEHPGLLALGQPITLIPPAEETFERRRYFVTLAAHELAHYWFGDLVTCAWWDDTWLNEALGTWADHKVTDAFDPKWRWALSAADRREHALVADALPSAKKLRQEVASEDDIQNSFDSSLTYDKGATVL